MIDLPSILKHPYEFILDFKISETMISEIVRSQNLPKAFKDIQVTCHEGYLDLIITMQALFFSKTINLKLAIDSIQLGQDKLIIVFRDIGKGTRVLSEILSIVGIKSLSGVVFHDNLIELDLSDKWRSFINQHGLLREQMRDISVTHYAIIVQNILLTISNQILV